MIYPKFIKENDTIGVTAISDGVVEDVKIYRLNNAIKNIGFKVKETPDVRTSTNGFSASSDIQASELHSLVRDKDISSIIFSGGGEFASLNLPFIDFDLLRGNPKWIQGYSDATNILFAITTNLDIATVYGDNFTSFGMKPWHESLHNNIEILKGHIIKQNSFSMYESSYQKYLKGDEPYKLDLPVKWKNLNNEESITIKGRIIGGCIDCLNDLFGTKYDNTLNFINKYKSDGIIWYFDNCELSSEQLIRTLNKFKDNGWFKYTNGIVFGRSATNKSYYNISFSDAIRLVLGDLNIPIISDADIGHVAPRMTIINGSIATVNSSKGKGSIWFELK